jgi:hypothetical protein
MPSGEQYTQAIIQAIEPLNNCVIRNAVEAKRYLQQIRSMQKEVRSIKKEAGLQIKQFRLEFQHQRTKMGGGFFGGFGRGLFGRGVLTARRQDSRIKQDQVLAPYLNAQHVADKALIELDRLKLQIEEAIAMDSF